MTGAAGNTNALTVGILASSDVPAVVQIDRVLCERGVNAVVIDPGEDMAGLAVMVVVLTRALCADENAVSSLADARAIRLVPVRVEDLTGVRVPPYLSELNWILWDVSDSAVRNAQLMAAVHTDVGQYREAKSLEAIAAAWEASGHDPDYLMSDRAAVREAWSRIGGTTDNPFDHAAPPSPRLQAFLANSDRSTRRLWWRRNRRWAFRLAALSGVIAIAITGWQTYTEQRAANLLAVTLINTEIGDRYDLVALKIAALIDQQSAADRPIPYSAVGRLMETMSEDWDSGVIGVGAAGANNSFAFVGERDILVADGHGAVSLVSTDDGTFAWRRAVSARPLVHIAANTDGTRFVAVDVDDVAYAVDVADWSVTSAELPGSLVDLAVSQSGTDPFAAELAGGRIVAIADGQARDIGQFDAVLDLVESPTGSPRALVRSGSTLKVIDAVLGTVRVEAEWPAEKFEKGALSPTEDRVAVTGPGQQLWFAPDGMHFQATGWAIPDVVRAIAVTPTDAIVASSDSFGAALYDPHAGARSRVCTTVDYVEELVVNADGGRILCASLGLGVVDSLSAAKSAPPSAAGAEMRDSTGIGPIQRATIEGTRVIVRVGDETLNLDADSQTSGSVIFGDAAEVELAWIPGRMLGDGEPSAVAVSPDGQHLVVGMTSGVVSTFDIDYHGLLALASRWTVPDGQPVSSLVWAPGSLTLSVRTSADRWWAAPNCVGCGKDVAKLLDEVRARLWFCYGREAWELLQPRTRERLGVRLCAEQPAAELR